MKRLVGIMVIAFLASGAWWNADKSQNKTAAAANTRVEDPGKSVSRGLPDSPPVSETEIILPESGDSASENVNPFADAPQETFETQEEPELTQDNPPQDPPSPLDPKLPANASVDAASRAAAFTKVLAAGDEETRRARAAAFRRLSQALKNAASAKRPEPVASSSVT